MVLLCLPPSLVVAKGEGRRCSKMEAGATSCGAPGEPGVVDVVVGDKDCLRTAIVYSLLTVLQSLNRAGRFGWPG